ncbi:unnamed protein product [Adineta steineri]|uniref:Uncharacterized protein n=1 Tax=Adineta steineri TaxID=433720 RepID=A0A820L4P6_9BILA|nr:unnamed protein product [Adineta steineri]
MDVDRGVDEDKDSNPNKRISQVQKDRRIVDERELSDSEDEDGDKRRNQSNAKYISNKRKASSDSLNGVTLNGNAKVLATDSVVNTTVTQITKTTEATVVVPSVNGNEISTENSVLTTTTTTIVNGNVETEAIATPPKDNMDTSETS